MNAMKRTLDVLLFQHEFVIFDIFSTQSIQCKKMRMVAQTNEILLSVINAYFIYSSI